MAWVTYPIAWKIMLLCLAAEQSWVNLRGGYQFTVYIEKRYFMIDICIKSIKYVLKKIHVSIINVSSQKLFIWTKNPPASSKIAIILG